MAARKKKRKNTAPRKAAAKKGGKRRARKGAGAKPAPPEGGRRLVARTTDCDPGPIYEGTRREVLRKLAQHALRDNDFRSSARDKVYFECHLQRALDEYSDLDTLNDAEIAACIGWADLADRLAPSDQELQDAINHFLSYPSG